MMIRAIPFLALLLLASPVLADTRCALVQDGIVKDYRAFKEVPDPVEDGCPRDLPHKGITWLPAPVAERPAFDAATQALQGPTVTIGKDAVTQEYTVRHKTARELADETEVRRESVLDGVGELVLRRLCDHESRIRVLEGKSAVTWEQCRAAIKAALQ